MTRGAADGAGVDPLRLYLKEIGRYPLLTRADEARLAQAIHAAGSARTELAGSEPPPTARRGELDQSVRLGDAARTEFVQANLRLVVSVAKRYQGPGVPLLDLIQEGNLGLLRAVDKFDWQRGFKFSTYATWWIRQAIRWGIDNTSRTIRLPVQAAGLVRHVRRVTTELEVALQRPPRLEEVASACAVDPAAVLATRCFGSTTVSLNDVAWSDSETERGDLVKDMDAADPVEEAMRACLGDEVDRVLAGLDDRERQILRLRFGLDRGVPRTLEEVGTCLSLTRERIRQIEARAMAKARSNAGPEDWTS